jgi:hypothetical protein
MKTAAAENPLLSGAAESGAAGWNVRYVRSVHVLTPFPDVARQVDSTASGEKLAKDRWTAMLLFAQSTTEN